MLLPPMQRPVNLSSTSTTHKVLGTPHACPCRGCEMDRRRSTEESSTTTHSQLPFSAINGQFAGQAAEALAAVAVRTTRSEHGHASSTDGYLGRRLIVEAMAGTEQVRVLVEDLLTTGYHPLVLLGPDSIEMPSQSRSAPPATVTVSKEPIKSATALLRPLILACEESSESASRLSGQQARHHKLAQSRHSCCRSAGSQQIRTARVWPEAGLRAIDTPALQVIQAVLVATVTAREDNSTR